MRSVPFLKNPVNKFSFQIRVNGKPSVANLRFATKAELRRYHRFLSSVLGESSEAIRDAVEFTRLAAKRWRYYSEAGEAAESLAELRQAFRRNKHREVAFILIATIQLENHEMPIGLAYCRRTWCHHLALDFLALHPRALERTWRVNGAGSGIIFGLVQLANILNITRVWGEATVNSAPFYEKLLEISPIEDLFIIERVEMAAIIRRQEKISHPRLGARPAIMLS
jgi:hypothetical protein